jgi:cytoskeletal protein RodZ
MEEQLPSGILLFFALSFFLTAVFVFFSGGEGSNPLSVVLGIAFVVLGGIFVWLVGYGSNEQAAKLPQTMESTAQETTSAPVRSGQTQTKSISYANYCIEKQFAEATQGMDQQQAIDYETGVINESVVRGVDPRTVLSERGFPC